MIRLDTRVDVSDIINASVEAFHNTSWYEESSDIPERENKAKGKLEALIKSVKPVQFEDVQVIFQGYLSFLQYKSLHMHTSTSQSSHQKSLEQLHFDFYKSDSNCNPQFVNLFEFINIKSYSEAYCESVGSLMNIMVNKGRVLAAGNFSRELIFAFNSPPIHILSQSFIREIAEYIINEQGKVPGNEKIQMQIKISKIAIFLWNL